MRVVFLTHNYPRHAGDVAGAFLHPLALALRARGVDLQVIAPSDRGQEGADTLDGVPVRRVRYALSHDETLAYTGTMQAALRSLRGYRAFTGMVEAFRREVHQELATSPHTVVHAHWWVPAGLAVPRGARSVITCHGTDVRLLDGALPFRWIGRHVLRRAGLVTVVSGALAAVIERRTGIVIPEDQVQAMPLAPGDRPVSTGGGGLVVIGRLTDQKRVDLAIRACHALRERGSPRTLRIVGDGPARPRLEALAATLALGDLVQFTGEVAPTEVPAILATADLLLMPAQREGMGLAAAEALIQGVPVVACEDGGGLLDVVPTSGGGRIVAATAEALADGITAITSDAGAADGAWMAGRAWQHRLAADQVAARCLGWYEHVLAA